MTRTPLALLVAAPTAAFVAMAVWILWDVPPRGRSARFVASPQFVVWLLILCGQAAVWALASGFVWITVSQRIRELWRRDDVTSTQLGGLAVALLILILLAVARVPPDDLNLYPVELRDLPAGFPLDNHSHKVRVIVVIGAVIGFTAIAGMWAAAMLLDRLRPTSRPTPEWRALGLRYGIRPSRPRRLLRGPVPVDVLPRSASLPARPRPSTRGVFRPWGVGEAGRRSLTGFVILVL